MYMCMCMCMYIDTHRHPYTSHRLVDEIAVKERGTRQPLNDPVHISVEPTPAMPPSLLQELRQNKSTGGASFSTPGTLSEGPLSSASSVPAVGIGVGRERAGHLGAAQTQERQGVFRSHTRAVVSGGGLMAGFPEGGGFFLTPGPHHTSTNFTVPPILVAMHAPAAPLFV